ncbi:MAG: cupin domain-containing protein [Caldilineales bacterium]|nr:cupin domain-containing protein [Caldilineales bacterium]
MVRRVANTDVTPVEMIPGLFRRTLAEGARAMLCEFTAAEGVFIPLHSHPHEQVGYVIEGRVAFVCGDETFIAEPGYSYAIPGGAPHSARFLAPTKLVEIFSPPREEYR